MTRALWWRFVVISTVFALLLSGIYLLVVRQTNGSSNLAVQRGIYLFVAHLVESAPYQQSVNSIEDYRSESPMLALKLWVLTAKGEVIASNSAQVPPLKWLSMAKPMQIHEVTFYARWFPSAPELILVRLRDPKPTYLLVGNELGLPMRRLLFLQSMLFIVTIGGASFLGLVLTTVYLRGRSRAAKDVIARMEAGDLSARFSIERFDSFGNLMLDFNRMAAEIERLVRRLQSAENTRRELLQELGHDLRTPLTSLRTAIETLEEHRDVMPPEQQGEFMRVIHSELDYCQRLLDDLFFIADLSEPRYRQGAQTVDLRALLTNELHVDETGVMAPVYRSDLRCSFDAQLENAQITGDPHLILRAFRNAFDNACKHARAQVKVSLIARERCIDIVIADDGSGMTAAAMEKFGQRRAQRLPIAGSSTAVSLGLGSVIIKSIIDLHGGHIIVTSGQVDASIAGTELTLSFPK
jgi:signal transduction histidine kinase